MYLFLKIVRVELAADDDTMMTRVKTTTMTADCFRTAAHASVDEAGRSDRDRNRRCSTLIIPGLPGRAEHGLGAAETTFSIQLF